MGTGSATTSPARVVLCGYGTEGDSRPLVALACWLTAHGHDVTLLLEADGVAQARERGLRAHPLAGNLRDALTTSNAHARHAQTTLRLARRHTGDWARAIRSAAAEADVVVGSGLAVLSAQAAAYAAGLPFVGVSMFPVVPTRAFPPPLLPVPLPRQLNRGAHELPQRLLWWMLGRRVAPVRREWGVPPVPMRFDDHITLCAVSPTLVSTPPDWPEPARVVGDLRDGSPPAPLDARVLDFLRSGPPPVYVGLGSMTLRRPQQLRAAVLDLSASRRVVFAPGWSGVRVPQSPSLLSIGNVPHDLLFPHVAAVVQHGGAGTVHAAARAGVPQVVVPVAGDQLWWARRVCEAGISTRPLRLAHLTGLTLADAVRAAESLRPRAIAVAAAMAEEDGCAAVGAAVQWAAVQCAVTTRPATTRPERPE